MSRLPAPTAVGQQKSSQIEFANRPLRIAILLCPGSAGPDSLVAALSRRGALVRVLAEPPSVMVELAFTPTDVVIIAEPALQPVLTDLLAALSRYHPKTQCWQYVKSGKAGQPELAPINGELLSASAPGTAMHSKIGLSAKVPGAVEPAPRPAKLQSLPGVKPPVQAAQAVAGPLVSEEELAMLLGPWPPNNPVAHH